MPETPDFDQIARQTVSGSEFHIQRVAEQLRLIWNARGAADLATLDTILSEAWQVGQPARVVTMKTFDQALRKLNR